MWESFLNALITAFSTVFQVFRMFFVWIFEHTWAFVLSIFLPIMGLVDKVIETLTYWLNDTLEGVFTDSEYDFTSVFDAIDYFIQSFLGDDFLSMILKDIVYIFNFSSFVEKVLTVIVPLLLSCVIYKVVKSWIPTVSGS